MGKSIRDISFKTFIESVKRQELRDFTKRRIGAINKLDIKVKSADNFGEMRQHILKQYSDTDVVKSFEDHNGQIWDCIAVNKQPALNGTNREIANAPDISSQVSKERVDKIPGTKRAASFLSDKKQDKYGNVLSCPEGYVPVRRIRLEEMIRFESLQNFFKKTPRLHVPDRTFPVDVNRTLQKHKYAHAAQEVVNTGGHSVLSINSPVLQGSEIFSLSQQWYTAGDGESLQTIEGGWQVFPSKYDTQEPCLFIYYTADNYHSENGYNLETNAFCQSSNKWALGGPLIDTENAGGDGALELDMTWALVDGKWWLYLNGNTPDDAVGYYPVEIFSGGPMSVKANYIDYGGETVGTDSWPEMGSGAFPDTGAAAYQRNINYFDLQGSGFWADLRISEDFPNCYKIGLTSSDSWGTYFYYGGPGGRNC